MKTTVYNDLYTPEGESATGGEWDVYPRPQLVRDIVFMSDEQRKRADTRPGLTGLAQIRGRNAISWEEKFNYDVEYVDSVGFVRDWKIIFQTVLTVLRRDGINSATSVTMEEFMGTEEKHD